MSSRTQPTFFCDAAREPVSIHNGKHSDQTGAFAIHRCIASANPPTASADPLNFSALTTDSQFLLRTLSTALLACM